MPATSSPRSRFRRRDVLRFMLDPGFRRDPYPLYARLRSHQPVHTSVLGATLVSSHPLVLDCMRDPRLSNSERNTDFSYSAGRDGAGLLAEAPFRFLMLRGGAWQEEPKDEFSAVARRFLLAIDAPDHTRLRSLVARAFTPRAVNDAAPLVEKIAHELLDGIEVKGGADLLAAYAYELPVRVICQMLGVPPEDYPRFHSWVVPLVARFDVAQIGSKDLTRRAADATRHLRAYLLELADRRRRDPRDDLISLLVTAADDGDLLGEDELVSVVTLLLVAGHETTANLNGNSVWHLHRHPEQLRRFREEPSLRRNAVEELLRFDSPIQIVQRIATEDVEVGGVRVAKGRMVIPLIGAANRDPDRFADPDRLDLGRVDCQATSFGFGPHHCVGASLARLEGELGLGVLVDRLPGLRITTDAPQWRSSIVFRGLKELPARWD